MLHKQSLLSWCLDHQRRETLQGMSMELCYLVQRLEVKWGKAFIIYKSNSVNFFSCYNIFSLKYQFLPFSFRNSLLINFYQHIIKSHFNRTLFILLLLLLFCTNTLLNMNCIFKLCKETFHYAQ